MLLVETYQFFTSGIASDIDGFEIPVSVLDALQNLAPSKSIKTFILVTSAGCQLSLGGTGAVYSQIFIKTDSSCNAIKEVNPLPTCVQLPLAHC
jgi:hypothetical protein